MSFSYNIFGLKNKLAILWVRNGVLSLALAGLYSIVLVILKNPPIKSLIPNSEIYKTAFVVQANLSGQIWLLSITAIIWCQNFKFHFWGVICSRLALFGIIMIGCSPFFGQDLPVMSHYIPMLENIVFILGLSLFGTTMLLFAINVIYGYVFSKANIYKAPHDVLIGFAAISSAAIFIVVWFCFALSYAQLHGVIKLVPVDIEFYYELLYWSGGHMLYFLYTQILLIVWVLLFQIWVAKNLHFYKFYLFALSLNFLLVLGGFAGHFFYDIVDGEFMEYYTIYIKYFGGIVPIVSLLLLLVDVFKDKKLKSLLVKHTIACSGLLFLLGGLIGVHIIDMNITIPAEYPSSIIGISIAFMGIVYVICDSEFSYNQTGGPIQNRFQTWQIYIIFFGQILNIGGLACAGIYEVFKKNVITECGLVVKIAAGLIEAGELIAIIGSLMFVFICGKRLCSLSLRGN